MEFDAFGHLTPYEVIETDFATFEAVFVNTFPVSLTRRGIFEAYIDYLNRLTGAFGTGFHQWLGGSYITRKPNPEDLDVVTFLDYQRYESQPRLLWEFRQTRLQQKQRIDGYLVPVYPEGHPKRSLFESDQIQWRFDFGRNLHRYRNGILQLNF